MQHKAKKIVIITEKVILDGVTRIIERCGGTGYTVLAAGGKGARGVRSADRLSIGDTFANVKIEAIVPNQEIAERIAEEVAAAYFADYSGITYLQDAEILRPGKFSKSG